MPAITHFPPAIRPWILLLILVTLSTGCAQTPQFTWPFQLPDANGIVGRLEVKRFAIRSFALKGDTQLITPTQELYGSHMILGRHPNRIRAELVGPFGRPVLTLVCDGTFLTALDLNQSKASGFHPPRSMPF